MREPTTSYAMRLPTRLLEQVREMAARQRRSINAQLVYLVERGMEAEGQKPERPED